ncbi:MAG: MBL fold metallo-hydrolase [Sandaracinaceae bacterium]|nr:MBL fold metallo-hydrolase [Sandaracinaceae bacterium]
MGRNLLPDLLYVFVAGPGTGEGIAVALPGADWIVVDGCEVGGASVTAAILRAYLRSGDEQRAFFLTHPHDDHVGGVPELLERHRPDAVWLTAKAPHGPHLLEVCRAWLTKLEARPTSDGLRARGVHGALKAIRAGKRAPAEGSRAPSRVRR